MSIRNEILPPEAHIRTLIEEVVVPILNQVAKDSEKRVILSAVIMVGVDSEITLSPIASEERDAPIIEGKLRLRFREAFGGRMLMHCECIFEQSQAVGNCSGFSLKGELKGGVAKRTAWTMRYSVWDWTGWV